MEIYTVSLFGHREDENPLEAESRLERLLRDIIRQKEYVDFLIGRDGEFDLLAASVIKRAIQCCGNGNTHFTLVLPYMKSEYRDNELSYLNYYDDVEVCTESSKSHYKSAIQVRNKNMVDRSDLVICYINHKSGGAYKTVQYSKNQGKTVINIAKTE